MKQENSVNLRADVGGKVVFAIYGFCDIRNFTDCTEVISRFESFFSFLNRPQYCTDFLNMVIHWSGHARRCREIGE